MKTVIGNCELYLGDCSEVMKKIPRVSCIVTDPPYEFETSGGGIFRRNRDNMDKIQEAGLDKGFDHLLLSGENCDSCVVFCHNDQLPKLLPYIDSAFDRFALCSWHKSNPMPVANQHYQPDTEFYIHAWNIGFAPTGALKDKKRYYFGQSGKDTDVDHPTVKPIPLMEKIIVNINSDIVLDPFMGSGSTGVACMKLGKKFVGIEINPKFYEIACKRLKEEYDQLKLF